jgi:hypothetical protein
MARPDIGTESERAQAVQDKLEEFMNYVTANVHAIANYADRHRNAEPIATGFVESTVKRVVSKRFVKKRQMPWTPLRAHRLLQVRARVLDGDRSPYIVLDHPVSPDVMAAFNVVLTGRPCNR